MRDLGGRRFMELAAKGTSDELGGVVGTLTLIWPTSDLSLQMAASYCPDLRVRWREAPPR